MTVDVFLLLQTLDDQVRSRQHAEQQYANGLQAPSYGGRPMHTPQQPSGVPSRGGYSTENSALIISMERQVERLIEDFHGTYVRLNPDVHLCTRRDNTQQLIPRLEGCHVSCAG